jgi:hypothetical protein
MFPIYKSSLSIPFKGTDRLISGAVVDLVHNLFTSGLGQTSINEKIDKNNSIYNRPLLRHLIINDYSEFL